MKASANADDEKTNDAEKSKRLTLFGSRLFKKNVSGARVVSLWEQVSVGGTKFAAYGSHHDHYPVPYVVCSCTIGITQKDIDLFIARMRKSFS